MFPRSNIHSHTTYSDGRNTPEEMVRAALARGFVSFGFSDHGYAPHDTASMSREGEALYRREIRSLIARYEGQIELALGYEHDHSMPEADLSAYDYVIESVHFVHKRGVWCSVDESADMLQSSIDEYFQGDPYRFCADYFDEVCRSIMDTPARIVGHIGLVSKFNEGDRMFDSGDRRYTDPAREAIRLAVERDLLVEVNTGAMSRGYRTEPYPGRTLLRYLNSIGGRVILTSDCHRREWIDFAFDECLELLRSCGFREAWLWKNGGFTSLPI